MSTFMQIRDRLRRFFSHHEIALYRTWHLIMMLASLYIVQNMFPVSGTLQSPVLILVISVFGMFLQVGGCALLIFFYLMLHLVSLDIVTALVVFGLIFVGYLICLYYQTKAAHHLVLIPVTQQMGIPFLCPMISGLTGELRDVTGVVTGGVIAFYLNVLRENSALLADGTSRLTSVQLLTAQVLQNRMFYFYLAALVAMFLVIYLVRTQNIRSAWILAVVFGVAVEFAIMLAGLLFTSDNSGISSLLIGNLIVLVIGILMTYFLMDLDYHRIEKVQFEDDDYYYYVTAVPKIRIETEQKTVTKITREKSEPQKTQKAPQTYNRPVKTRENVNRPVKTGENENRPARSQAEDARTAVKRTKERE